jgi:hypothetical protein
MSSGNPPMDLPIQCAACDIDDAVRGFPAWREKENLLQSVPGVGPVIARLQIAEARHHIGGLGKMRRNRGIDQIGLGTLSRALATGLTTGAVAPDENPARARRNLIQVKVRSTAWRMIASPSIEDSAKGDAPCRLRALTIPAALNGHRRNSSPGPCSLSVMR